jgi:hypothetical protein
MPNRGDGCRWRREEEVETIGGVELMGRIYVSKQGREGGMRIDERREVEE